MAALNNNISIKDDNEDITVTVVAENIEEQTAPSNGNVYLKS